MAFSVLRFSSSLNFDGRWYPSSRSSEGIGESIEILSQGRRPDEGMFGVPMQQIEK
jgi:hypothetical protein